jgi:hypothetical protein
VLGYVGGSRQKYAEFVQVGIREGFTTPWEDLQAQMVLGDRDFVEKLKGMKISGSAKDQPSYRMIQSIDAEALIKKARIISGWKRQSLPRNEDDTGINVRS